MVWVVGIQIDADARIVYVHMDDLKRCASLIQNPLGQTLRAAHL